MRFSSEQTTLWRTYCHGYLVRDYKLYNSPGMAAAGCRHFRSPVKRLSRPLVAHRRTVVSPGLVFRLCGGSCHIHILGGDLGRRKHFLAWRSDWATQIARQGACRLDSLRDLRPAYRPMGHRRRAQAENQLIAAARLSRIDSPVCAARSVGLSWPARGKTLSTGRQLPIQPHVLTTQW